MAKKPTPKSQKDISISQHDPYSKEMGNPNSIGQENRGEQTSFRGDTTKPFSIGLQDIDESLMYYFQKVIKPFVVQNDVRIEVPVIYGSPEKWKSYQKDGYYRDVNGKIMAPLIMFKMESFDKDRSKGNKLDANNPNNFGVFVKKYSSKDTYSNFNVLTNKIPEKTYYASVIPDYLNLTYSCVVFTNYVEQLNKILEAIQYASDSYWGDPEKFQFNAQIDSFNIVTEINTGEDRIVKSNFTIKLKGHIIPDLIQKDLNFIKKFSDRSQVIFDIETSLDSPDQVSPGRRISYIDSPIPVNNIISSGFAYIINSGSSWTGSFSAGTTSSIPNAYVIASGSGVFIGSFAPGITSSITTSGSSGPFTIYARDSGGTPVQIQIFPNPNNGQYIIEPFGLMNYLGQTIQSAYYPSQSLLDVSIRSEDLSGSISEWNVGRITGLSGSGYGIDIYVPRLAIRLSNNIIFDYASGGDSDYSLHSSSIRYYNSESSLVELVRSTTSSGDYLSPDYIIPIFEIHHSNGNDYLTGDIINNIITLAGVTIRNSGSSYSSSAEDGTIFNIPNTYLINSGSSWTGSIPSAVTSSIPNAYVSVSGSSTTGSFAPGITSSLILPILNLTDSNGSGSVVQTGRWPGPIKLSQMIISRSAANNSTEIWDVASIVGVSSSVGTLGAKFVIDKIIPRLSIGLTNSASFTFVAGASTNYYLPNTTLLYFNKSNLLSSTSSSTTASGANLAYSGTIGRFEVLQYDGVSAYLTGDIFNRIITLVGSRVQNSGSTYSTTLTDGSTGSIPNTYLINSGSSWTGSVASAVTSSIPNAYVNISGSSWTGSFAPGITSSLILVPNVQRLTEFTASGTWTKPDNLKEIVVFAVGSGGGGGSGRSTSTANNCRGGGAGGGGAFVNYRISASLLSSSEAVVIGNGGAGGAGALNAVGASGSNGGDVSFGSFVIAKGAAGGEGGNAGAGVTPTNPAVVANCTPIGIPWCFGGQNGTTHSGGANTPGTNGVTAQGGRGGNRVGAAVPSDGGDGGGAFQNQTFVNGGLAPSTLSTVGGSGSDTKYDYMSPHTILTSSLAIGTAGAGGSYGSSSAGGNGGAGGKGSGGGGGGGSLNTQTSGTGGAGGKGFIVVLEIFN